MSTLKTQAEIIMERGRVKASTTVYSGPGYPIDPKLDEARMFELFLDTLEKHLPPKKLQAIMPQLKSLPFEPPKKQHLTIGGIKAVIKEWDVPPYNWYEFVDDDQKSFSA